jgi:hypothetical protein
MDCLPNLVLLVLLRRSCSTTGSAYGFFMWQSVCSLPHGLTQDGVLVGLDTFSVIDRWRKSDGRCGQMVASEGIAPQQRMLE